MSEAIFSHSGKVGDLIYALPFALAYVRMYNIKRTAFNLNVLPGRRLYTRESAEALAALLRSQHWVDAVWFDRPEEATVNLDAGNHTWVRHNSGDLARRFALLGREFPEPIDFTAPWLFGIEPDPRAKGRIVLFRSLRYRNDRLNYLSLLRWRDRLLFLGSPEEYDEFASRTFQCDYLPTGDFFEAARLIRGAALTIGNQTGLFAIAEALKVSRLLEISPTCPNVIMQGGWNRDLLSEEDLEAALRLRG